MIKRLGYTFLMLIMTGCAGGSSGADETATFDVLVQKAQNDLMTEVAPTALPEPTPTRIIRSASSIPTTWMATLVCDECAELGMEISIWKHPAARELLFTVPNRARVTVLDTATLNGIDYLKIRSGAQEGWVTADFAQP